MVDALRFVRIEPAYFFLLGEPLTFSPVFDAPPLTVDSGLGELLGLALTLPFAAPLLTGDSGLGAAPGLALPFAVPPRTGDSGLGDPLGLVLDVLFETPPRAGDSGFGVPVGFRLVWPDATSSADITATAGGR